MTSGFIKEIRVSDISGKNKISLMKSFLARRSFGENYAKDPAGGLIGKRTYPHLFYKGLSVKGLSTASGE